MTLDPPSRDAEWSFTKHAMQRALDMALDPDEIRGVLNSPKVSWVMDAYPECTALTNYHIIAAVDKDTRSVITFLWYRGPRTERFSRELEDDLKRIRDRKKLS